MGIGVSYTGRKGSRQFTLDGAPEAGSEAAGILGDASRRVTEALTRKNPDVIKNYFGGGGDDHTVKATRDDPSPGTLDEKVARMGAIAVDGGKLLLKGEEGGKAVPGNKAYGSIGGNRGYYGLDEIDPPDNPKHIGYVGGGLGEDKTEAKDGEAVKWQQVSHVEVEHDDILGKDILVEYERDVAKSPQGRVVAVSAERRRVLSTILCGGEGAGGGGFVGDGVFVPLEDADGKVTSFAYRYYQIGGYTFEASDRTPAKTGTTLVALQLNATSWSSSTGPGGSLVEYASVSALQTAQSDPEYYRIPLYLITDGSVTVDFRRMPFTGMIEQFGSST